MRLSIGGALFIGSLLCGALFVWAAATGLEARRCLEGQSRPDFDGAVITERGCEVTTTSGETLVVPISGPPFEAGVAGALGFVVLGTATAVTLVRRALRRSVG
ncbi:hypothetical protein ACE14D_13655 [Streptomyces sp. Act-28]